MSGKQRLITDVFAQYKKDVLRSSKAKTDTKTVALDTQAAQQLLRDKEIKVLKQFDLCLEYGPCIGISRLERWARAKKHGMNPPDEIRRIILKNEDKDEYTQSLWQDYPL